MNNKIKKRIEKMIQEKVEKTEFIYPKEEKIDRFISIGEYKIEMKDQKIIEIFKNDEFFFGYGFRYEHIDSLVEFLEKFDSICKSIQNQINIVIQKENQQYKKLIPFLSDIEKDSLLD